MDPDPDYDLHVGKTDTHLKQQVMIAKKNLDMCRQEAGNFPASYEIRAEKARRILKYYVALCDFEAMIRRSFKTAVIRADADEVTWDEAIDRGLSAVSS